MCKKMAFNVQSFVVILCIFLGRVKLKPVNEVSSTELENHQIGQNKAGITDVLNPQNWKPLNKDGQNLLVNLTDSQKDVKLFFITVQGALMPASVITGGFGNVLQSLANTGQVFGNLGQSLQNLNPLDAN